MFEFKKWLGDNGSCVDNRRYDSVAHVFIVSRSTGNVSVPFRNGDNDRFAPRLEIVSDLLLEVVVGPRGNRKGDYSC